MKKNHPILVGLDKVKPYRTVTGTSLYSIKPPADQIEDFLTVGGIMGLTAYPGVGKSWLAMEITRAVTSGSLFLGKKRATRGGVLYVGSDSSIPDYARQWTRLTSAVPDADDVFEPARFLLQSSFMFEDRDEIRKLIATHRAFEWGSLRQTDHGPVRERGFHVIVFDTVSKLTRTNQNDNTAMEEVFRHIRWVAEATDAAVILLHHNSKKSEFNDGSDWRGASSGIGGLDSWVHLSPGVRDKHLIGVQFKKYRGITPSDFAYKMNVMEKETASLDWSEAPATREQIATSDILSDQIKSWLTIEPDLRACELRDALWPKFETGVADLAGKTLQFSSKTKFTNALNNRITLLLSKNLLKRDINPQGKATYRVHAGSLQPGDDTVHGD